MTDAEFQAKKQSCIDGIDAEMLKRLKDFAFYKLKVVELPLPFFEDMPQIAIEQVLLGERIPFPMTSPPLINLRTTCAALSPPRLMP